MTKQENISQVEIQKYFEKNKNMLAEMFNRVDLYDFSVKLSLNAKHFYAYEGEEMVGFIAAYFNDPINRVAYISTVSVVLSYQGKGLGSKLLNEACLYAKEKDFRAIKLQVRKENNKALRWYEGFGFSILETLEDSYLLEKKVA